MLPPGPVAWPGGERGGGGGGGGGWGGGGGGGGGRGGGGGAWGHGTPKLLVVNFPIN